MNRLIELAYDVAMEKSPWEPLLDALLVYSGGDYCALVHGWNPRVGSQPGGLRVVTVAEASTASDTDDLAAPPRWHEGPGQWLTVDPVSNLNLFVGLLQADMTIDESLNDRLGPLVPHILRAHQVRSKSQFRGAPSHLFAKALIEHLAAAVLLVDRTSKQILFANAASKQRFGVQTPSSRSPELPPLLRKLEEALPSARPDSIQPEVFQLDYDGRSVFGLSLPLPRQARQFTTDQADQIALIFLHDVTMVPELQATYLKDRYGLTPKEARLALGVTHGAGLKGLSDDFEVSHQTLRTQMKSVLKKTGAQSQAQLTLRLLQDEALMFAANSL